MLNKIKSDYSHKNIVRKKPSEEEKMSEVSKKSGDFVQIDTAVGLEAQYLCKNDSTYVKEDGVIYAAIPGILKINSKDRTIIIDSKQEYKRTIPQHGDIVTGRVYSIRKSSVGIRIGTLNQKLVSYVGLIGNIHVASVSRSYIDKLDNVFQKTDIVRAKVITKSGKEYKIATNSPNLGVILSDCKYCGKAMVRKGSGQLVCPFCNHTERKILAQDYGNLQNQLKFD